MGRKRNVKDHHSSSSSASINSTDDIDNNHLYRKRLRSWKQTSSKLKPNHLSSFFENNDGIIKSHRQSTIFTYPISHSNDRQSIISNTILSDSLTTESAFFCSSIPYNSIRSAVDLNNNQVTTLNTDIKKRKMNSISCESIPSEISQIKQLELSSNRNDQASIDSLQLTHLESPMKRSRISANDSIITKNYLLPIDNCTIDINQQEPISSPIELLADNSNSMVAAVKMVQPIVDIIFNAFENQLKNIQTKSILSTSSDSTSTSQCRHPVMIPYFPPMHPIILHAVNFDIQLTTNDPRKKSALFNSSSNENDYSPPISLFSFEQKRISSILSKHLPIDNETKYKLKRMVQLAVFGASVLCGYLFL